MAEQSSPEQPNILFIITDQWRGDCLSVTGHPVVETPNIDELARCGVVFTSAFSPCPSCIAARASIFTGLSPTSHGRLGYQDCVPWNYDKPLAQVLADAGYQTHCVGKTHFFPQKASLGFQTQESYEAMQNFGDGYVNDYFKWLEEKTDGRIKEFDHGLQSNSWNARPSHLPEELHNNTWVVTRGLDFIRNRNPAKPFFLDLSFHRPHPPIDPPQVFWDMYCDRQLPPVPVGDWASKHDIPITGMNAWHGHLDPEILDRSRRAYYAQIAHIDNQIGRFINYARREAKLKNTWIIFMSDHGEMLGDHYLFRKAYAYQGSARVPLVICPPEGPLSGEKGGAIENFMRETPVTLTDIYPTILAMAGLSVGPEIEGCNLLPMLGGQDVLEGRQYVQGEHSDCYSPDVDSQFLTDGKWKYIWYPLNGEEHLFNLVEDPQELHNLAAEESAGETLELWRGRLIKDLALRTEDGLSDGQRLISGKTLPSVRASLLAK